MFGGLGGRRVVVLRGGKLSVTAEGRRFFAKAGFDVEALEGGRRPLCQPCLDWSERRSHLSGTLGAAILKHIVAHGWADREAKTRVVRVSAAGEQKLKAWFSR